MDNFEKVSHSLSIGEVLIVRSALECFKEKFEEGTSEEMNKTFGDIQIDLACLKALDDLIDKFDVGEDLNELTK